MAKGFAARMPKARFLGVPNVGHVPHLEAPAAFSTAVLEFLR
jgi:pimeloyl-ACP methyl ester carboxylesterase